MDFNLINLWLLLKAKRLSFGSIPKHNQYQNLVNTIRLQKNQKDTINYL